MVVFSHHCIMFPVMAEKCRLHDVLSAFQRPWQMRAPSGMAQGQNQISTTGIPGSSRDEPRPCMLDLSL